MSETKEQARYAAENFGAVAYEAWVKASSKMNTPLWHSLPADERAAWIAVADAVQDTFARACLCED